MPRLQPAALNASSGSSDGSIGVEHHSERTANGAGWQVSSELGLDDAAVSMGVNDLAPNALEVGTSLSVLRSVNVGNALSVVESACLAIVATLDLNENLRLMLSSLATSETHENCFLVQSTQQTNQINAAYLTGCPVDFFFAEAALSTFFAIFM